MATGWTPPALRPDPGARADEPPEGQALLLARIGRLRDIAAELGAAEPRAQALRLIRDIRTAPPRNHVAAAPQISSLEFGLRRLAGARGRAAATPAEHSAAARVSMLFGSCRELDDAIQREAAARGAARENAPRLCPRCRGQMYMEAAAGELVCEECCATAPAASDRFGELGAQPQAGAARADTDHMRSSLDYLRKLQGHCPIDASPEEVAGLMQLARRDRITARTVSLAWCRAALAELRLTRLNDAIPALMRQHFLIDVPQMTADEENNAANGMVRDNAVYMQLRGDTTRRCNALAYPYNAYRQIDAMFPPGHSKRLLLALIHLQEAQTLQRHEDDAYHICRADNRPFYGISAPPRGPFPVIRKNDD